MLHQQASSDASKLDASATSTANVLYDKIKSAFVMEFR